MAWRFIWLFALLTGARGTNRSTGTDRFYSFWQTVVEAWGDPSPLIFKSGAPQVLTFADRFGAMGPLMCHVARSVEMAGGFLRILGLQKGRRIQLPNKHLHRNSSLDVFLKKYVLLSRSLQKMPPNTTVLFVDAFDVLFQRSIRDVVHTYERLAKSAAQAHGVWPVVFGGEMNCWPWPHNGSFHLPRRRRHRQQPIPRGNRNGTWHFHIPRGAALAADYHEEWRYPYPRSGRGSITSSEVCREWLLQRGDPQWSGQGRGARAPVFPFLNSGTFVGRAASILRLIRIMVRLYRRTGEMDDQALLVQHGGLV